MVGAFGDGFVFVFRSDTSGWSEWARLTPSDRTGSYFGYSVAVSGNVVLVGLPVDNIGSNADQGSAYVFRWNGSTWLEEAKLVASNGAANDVFGISVAIDGDVALVGAQRREVGGRTDQGAAYVFRWNGASWVEDAMLTASDGKAGDRFGHSVALSGDTALVGTYLDDVGGNTYQGAAYVFRRRASGWREVEKLTASDGGPYDLLGDSVALGEGLALVGAPQHQVVVPGPGPGYGEGAAYVFQLPAASQVPGLPASGMALLAALLASIGALVAKRARDARMRRASPERGRG